MRPGRRDLAILSLAISGWVAPATFPPGGVVFGSNGLPKEDLYRINIYVGAGGFFSRGAIVESTWEWTHGHMWPVAPWIPGYLLSLSVPLSVGLIIYSATCRKYLAVTWACLSLWLLVRWFEPYSSLSQLDWRSDVLTVVFMGYWCSLSSLWFGSSGSGEAERTYLLAKSSLLIYPVWVLALTVTQGRYPFVGWGLTAAGCTLLALRPYQPAHAIANANRTLDNDPAKG